jgi:hypothetical protein
MAGLTFGKMLCILLVVRIHQSLLREMEGETIIIKYTMVGNILIILEPLSPSGRNSSRPMNERTQSTLRPTLRHPYCPCAKVCNPCPPPAKARSYMLTTERHITFEKQDSIHRDAICSGLSLVTSRV